MHKPGPVLGLLVLLALLLLPGAVQLAQAQDDLPNVMITGIDSSAFPQMTVYVTVTDENGLSVPGLAAADFAVYEDGRQVAPNLVSVQAVPLASRYIVLAIDVSTIDTVLTDLQSAARAFVMQMKPEDRVSLVALHDVAEVLTPFTNNSQTLLTAIDGLSLTGNYTALNTTVTQSARMVEQYPPGHRALIIVPDSRNNTAPRSAEEAIATVQQVGVPLYIIGAKTEKIALPDLEEFATQTAGQVTVVEPENVQGTLLELARQLPRGYRLTYRSQLSADDAEHTLTVVAGSSEQISTQTEAGSASSRFVANSSAVLVSFVDLLSGQTVGGQVPLAVETQSIAPLAMVEYLLNGQPLTAQTTPPFGYTWDTTSTSPGVYTLTASATDQAGNQGLVDITLNIVPPVQVKIDSPQTVVAVGDEVPIGVKVEALNEIRRVDLLVNGKLIESDTTAPFSFSFDSSRANVGQHTVSVRAWDQVGYSGQDDISIKFLPAWREWLRKLLRIEDRARFDAWLLFIQQTAIVAVAALVMLLLILLALLLLRALHQRYLARSRQKVGVAVLNYGNIAGRYTLWATEPENRLAFKFTLYGQDLQMQHVTEVIAPARPGPMPSAAAAPVATASPQPQAAGDAPEMAQTRTYSTITDSDISTAEAQNADASTSNHQSEMANVSQTASKAAASTRKAMGISAVLGNMLVTTARILPAPLSRPLQNVASSMRGSSSRAKVAMRMPKQIKKVSSSVKQQAGSLKRAGIEMPGGGSPNSSVTNLDAPQKPQASPRQTAASSGSGAATPAAASQQTEYVAYAPAGGQNGYRAAPGGSVVTKTRTIRLDKAQTPAIEPGETVVVDMIVTPEQPFKRRDYPITVYIVPIEQPETAPTTETGTVHVPGLWWIFRFIPALVIWLVTAVLVLGVAWLAAWFIGINFLDYFYRFV